MVVTAREGIVPLCDKHRRRMLLFVSHGEGVFGIDAFTCPVLGCTRAYNTTNGYLDIVEGQAVLQMRQKLCPEDGTPMFLESVSPPKSVEHWRCGQTNCNGAIAIQP